MRLRQVLAAIAFAAPLEGCCLTDTIETEQRMPLPAMQDPNLAIAVAECKLHGDCPPLCERFDSFEPIKNCHIETDDQGRDWAVYTTIEDCAAGRRPAGYRRCSSLVTGPGAMLAAQARLEAASVRAFADLVADLRAHGAPRALRESARAAAADEVRHARTCRRLANAHGVRTARVRIAPAARRTLHELAVDNAAEGCVRESFGAVVAAYQARAAGDARVQRAMRTIARDEARHAELAWRIHAWLWPQLAKASRDDVVAAAVAARAQLRESAGREPAAVRRPLGLPDRRAAGEMLAHMDEIWAPVRAL